MIRQGGAYTGSGTIRSRPALLYERSLQRRFHRFSLAAFAGVALVRER
jgi:hypothetical protein